MSAGVVIRVLEAVRVSLFVPVILCLHEAAVVVHVDLLEAVGSVLSETDVYPFFESESILKRTYLTACLQPSFSTFRHLLDCIG